MKLSPSIPKAILSCLPDQGCVLEIGCGSGELIKQLSRVSRCDFYGIDPDPDMLRQAAGAGLQVTEGWGERIPYERNQFDAVVMECVFSLCNSVQTVRELMRVLRPGGIAVVADLYSGTCDLTFYQSRMLKHLYRPETIKCFFDRSMQLEGYRDYTTELRGMFLQMLMDRKLCDCVGVSDMPVLKDAKVGYGLWVWKKPEVHGICSRGIEEYGMF